MSKKKARTVVKKAKKKPVKLPFWGTILTLCGVAVLCTLGTWQMQRLEWKAGIIAALDAAYEGDGSAAPDLEKDFSYGKIGGVFHADKAILIGPRVREEKVGYDAIVPIVLEDGSSLLVNLGWTDIKDAADLPIHHGRGDTVYFRGLVRTPHANGFTPANVPEKGQWYRFDPQEIASAKGLENVRPRVLYAEWASYKFDDAFPNNVRQYPQNNHLQYAVFWFVMAGALVGVYVLRFLRR